MSNSKERNGLLIEESVKINNAQGIVDTNTDYSYETMEKDIGSLKLKYPFINVGIAGQSVLGRKLYYIQMGCGPNKVFYNAAHHALEWITSVLLMKFCEEFARAYAENRNIRCHNIRDIWSKSTIYIMPMINPDGVDLVLNGLKKGNPYYEQLLRWNDEKTDFAQIWQSNIRGVDLNHNYDASWQLSKQAERQLNIWGPGPTRFSGPYPESEPEVKAVVDFTRNHDLRLILAFHSQGEVIYWDYFNMAPSEAKEIGKRFENISGYKMEELTGITSYAGYKDWFIKTYKRPGYTIEVGNGKNPLPITQFSKIYDDTIGLMLLASIC